MSLKVLVAGATGAVGRLLVPRLREEGHWVRTLSRRPERARALRGLGHDVVIADATRLEELTGVAEGLDVIVSCLGANVGLGLRERRSYRDVDLVANENLLKLALRASVRRFVYVSVFVEAGYAHTRYVQAHEAFVRKLRESGISATVVRPTGIYTALDPFLDMAKHGSAFIVGDGTARTNPVDPRDVAEHCLMHLADGPPNVEIGGPDVLSRLAIAETAFRVVGTVPRFRRVPPWALKAFSVLARPLHPRLSELTEFAARVSTTDAIAPARGTRTLESYYSERFSGLPSGSPSGANGSNGKSAGHSASSFRITA